MARLTIGMPVFNDKAFIEEAISSLLNQTYSDFILIISDDGSTDGSQFICESFDAKEERVKYIRQHKNIGISKNMKFLLNQCQTEYFMWAADDDYWDKKYIEKLIYLLDKNPNSISAFCTFQQVDEVGNPISQPLNFDYSAPTSFDRLEKLIKNPNDSFGYGIFRKEKIKSVEFPIWWWPNQKDPYNNIYPSLCFYLSCGQYIQYTGEPLFFNRFKNNHNINHQTPFKKGSFIELMAYSIRRLNLVIFSIKMVIKGSDLRLALAITPELFYEWFFKSNYYFFKFYLKNKLTNK